MIRLERKHLELVAAIVREGSLTRAAEALSLSQPALSKQLAALEAMLGTPLFERGPRAMRPTPAGRDLEARARPVLEALAGMDRIMAGRGSGAAGRLRIATDPIHDDGWLGAALARFTAAHPGAEIDARPVTGALAALRSGRLDIAIVGEAPPDAALAYLPLDEDELVLVAPRTHRLAALSSISAADFEGCEIVYHLPLEATILHRRHLAPAGVRVRAFHRIETPAAILSAISAAACRDEGEGPVSVLPRRLVETSPAARSLVTVPVGPGGYRFRWYAAHLAAPPDSVRALLAALATAVPDARPEQGPFQTAGE